MHKNMSEEFDLFLKQQMKLKYMQELQKYVKKQRLTKEIYPAPNLVLNALKTCEYPYLKVVIIGNEPYSNPGVDMGIAYSAIGQEAPKELLEIQREIRRTEYPTPFAPNTPLFRTCNLTQWVTQDVLLINRILTVERERPGSHRGQGWEQFTENLLKMLNDHHNRLVFMLWGKENWDYANDLNKEKHLILKGFAPGSGKFYGCDHFSQCNKFITEVSDNTRGGIAWHLLN